VKLAVLNVVGEVDLEVSRTSGHHGNAILIIEAHIGSGQPGIDLLARLVAGDRRSVLNTLEQRVDESCNLFLRLDKQKALIGEIALAHNDDAIAVRMKVTAFPARKETALRAVRDFFSGLWE
jgi:RNA binding exosome subunit